MSCTSNKLVSLALNRPLAAIRRCSCIKEQRGFVGERNMNENILELEYRAMHWYVQRLVSACGIVLYDVRAAFPSLLHEA
eukprot:4365760-Pyramimonas_sp.AAC.1